MTNKGSVKWSLYQTADDVISQMAALFAATPEGQAAWAEAKKAEALAAKGEPLATKENGVTAMTQFSYPVSQARGTR